MSSSVRYTYAPTIISSRSLPSRLFSEVSALEQELKSLWPEIQQHPLHVSSMVALRTVTRARRTLFTPNVLVALLTVGVVVLTVIIIERRWSTSVTATSVNKTDSETEVTMLNVQSLEKPANDKSIGRGGKARVGFQNSTGEGSGEVRRRSQGGGGGGENELPPPQAGKLPPPSNIAAAIPKTPPLNPTSLPVAGIDIDPALWKDIKAPVYGDPRSTSNVSSKGPGEGGGIGTNKGLGIGEGEGPGVGPGKDGNMGGDEKQTGCCGRPGGRGDGGPSFDNRIFRGAEVEQRARLISKPEPQYTEEARRNQITGTVMLHVVFNDQGRVEQIRAVSSLPFGLTERAIAAARAIKFLPATKGGRPVSVYMQLEYNFNLY